MQTISGDQEGLIDLLEQLEFIEDFDKMVLIPIRDILSTGKIQTNYEEFLENKQVLTFNGKGKRIYSSFLVKMYLENRNLQKIRIQTSIPKILEKPQHARRRYQNIVDIEFHDIDLVDVQKRTKEYTLFFDNIFTEQNTGNYTSKEFYKGRERISKSDDIPDLSLSRTQNLQKEKEHAIIHS